MAGWLDLLEWIAAPQLLVTPILVAAIGIAYLRDLAEATIRDFLIVTGWVTAISAVCFMLAGAILILV